MISTLFTDAMSELNDKYITEAELYKKSNRTSRIVAWSAIAACLCIVFASAILIPHLFGSSVSGADKKEASDGVLETDIFSITMNNTDAVPSFQFPFLGSENHTPKSTEEMLVYYGLKFPEELMSEYSESQSSIPHGLYTFSDGTFDINDFVYARNTDQNELTIYIGKNISFGGLITGADISNGSESTINQTKVRLFSCEPQNCYYALFELNGCDLFVITHSLDEADFVALIKSIISEN